MTQTPPPVGIIMGSQSDWPTMREAAEMLGCLTSDDEVMVAGLRMYLR